MNTMYMAYTNKQKKLPKTKNLTSYIHCKPKPCKAYRELPVSQFSQEKNCFHYREPLFSLQGPCKPLYFPVRDCSVEILLFKTHLTIVRSGKGMVLGRPLTPTCVLQ